MLSQPRTSRKCMWPKNTQPRHALKRTSERPKFRAHAQQSPPYGQVFKHLEHASSTATQNKANQQRWATGPNR
eukprot:765604-Pelagomonas_calceolata.AAC.1